MCLPHFRVASHLDAGECVPLLTPNPPVSLYHTQMHAQTHTHTHAQVDWVEERLPWVTHRDRVLSRWAILIYVNKPCRCRERQRGHRWALVTSAPSLEGKAQTKSSTDTRRKGERGYWTVKKDTNAAVESDDKFSHTKTCFVALKSNSLAIFTLWVVSAISVAEKLLEGTNREKKRKARVSLGMVAANSIEPLESQQGGEWRWIAVLDPFLGQMWHHR